jgi:oligopeptidase A
MSQNPLLQADPIPHYDAVTAAHVEPAMRALLADLEAKAAALESEARAVARAEAPGPHAWEALAGPLERIQDRLGLAWGAVEHLLAVCNSDDLREAHDAVQGDVVAFGLRLGQSRDLHAAWQRLDGARGLNGLQRRVVALALRDAELAGVGLDGAPRERFNAVQTELADVATRFANHVLDATKAWTLALEPAAVADLPDTLKAQLARAWSLHNEGQPPATADAGPWLLTLEQPVLVPFLQHSTRRDLREQAWRAHVTRASSGDLDNTALLQKTLQLRHELARLLGFPDFAAVSLRGKMAPSVGDAARLLEDLRGASRAAAEQDLRDLVELAHSRGAVEADGMRPWDVAFWSERLREARFDLSDEALRPFFPLPHVLDGTFALCERLFGVRIEPDDAALPKWHPDVRTFLVRDQDGSPRARFQLDPYSRPAEKRGGAWMNESAGRSRRMARKGESVRLPVAILVCNQSPPVGDRPSLMAFSEVETWLHELGHGLQHMLTAVDDGLVSGIRQIEWDAVELPSQFMENWAWHGPTARELSCHVDSGARLDDATLQRLRAAKTFRAGSDMLRQLLFGLTDLRLHRSAPSTDPFAQYFDVARTCTVLPPEPDDRFLCAFSHIFAGGYAAGYYSYKWAEVLSADAFAAFEEAGLDDPAAVARTGKRFRDTVLSSGGAVQPGEVFRRFRGRDPSVEPLLRHAGLK